jgi:carbon monoxide dehydrogenase subunit G
MMTELIGAFAIAAGPTSPAPAGVEIFTTDTRIAADVDRVWDAVRDVYAVDTRLVPGMVTKVERQGDVRTVTFAAGYSLTERVIEIDERAHRITYAAFGGKASHHLATMQVLPDGRKKSRILWRTEFAPSELRPFIEQNMRQAAAIMKEHLEAQAR